MKNTDEENVWLSWLKAPSTDQAKPELATIVPRFAEGTPSAIERG